MSEIQQNSEIQAGLPKAVDAVSSLYAMRGIKPFDFQIKERTDERWEETAKKFPEFFKNIKELHTRLNFVDEAKKNIDPVLLNFACFPFAEIRNKGAKELLADVLLSRMLIPENRIDKNADPKKEIYDMGYELRLRHGWHGEEAKDLSLKEVVGSVLQGKLGILPQPKQKA